MTLHFQKRSRVFLGFFLFITTLSFSQELRLFNISTLDSLISDRREKILLVNIWATWCVPCKEEFPDLITLYKETPSDQLDIVAISVDYPDEFDSKIAPFLTSLAVPFPVFVSNVAVQDSFINAFHRDWSGAVPATFVYDTNGILQTYFIGKQQYAQFKKSIEDISGKP